MNFDSRQGDDDPNLVRGQERQAHFAQLSFPASCARGRKMHDYLTYLTPI